MTFDIFEQLAEKDVPPVPSNFDRQVHDRVNNSLFGVHITEFLFQVVPYAILHFGQAVIGLAALTLSGVFPQDRGDRTKHR
ncbi:MAG TPA: hypothetical protein VHD36_01015 [Pirellulales bacterium]|nr:hypothetical protein [Pirellulales bacterium]